MKVCFEEKSSHRAFFTLPIGEVFSRPGLEGVFMKVKQRDAGEPNAVCLNHGTWAHCGSHENVCVLAAQLNVWRA